MGRLTRLRCFFGRHVRSRGRARRVGTGWRSYCRNCGVEMFKEEGGQWYVVPPIEELDAELDRAPELPGEAIGTGQTATGNKAAKAGRRGWRLWRRRTVKGTAPGMPGSA